MTAIMALAKQLHQLIYVPLQAAAVEGVTMHPGNAQPTMLKHGAASIGTNCSTHGCADISGGIRLGVPVVRNPVGAHDSAVAVGLIVHSMPRQQGRDVVLVTVALPPALRPAPRGRRDPATWRGQTALVVFPLQETRC